MTIGSMYVPPRASVEYAVVTSNGEKACEPRASESKLFISDLIPAFWAV